MLFDISGTEVNCEIIGDGTPVILIHGFMLDHLTLKGCMEPVFNRDSHWRRIYLDLPGMGKTPSHKHIESTDQVLKLVVDLVNQLVPGENFLVVGHSYGGYLARGLIKQFPDRIKGAMFLCPMMKPARDERQLPEFRVFQEDKELQASLTPEELRKFLPSVTIQNERIWQRYQAEICSGVDRADLEYLEKLYQQYHYSFPHEQLNQVFDKPTLFFAGRQDDVVGYADQWEVMPYFPRASWALLDRASHNLQLEQEQLFKCLVADWLQRVLEEGV